MNIRTAVAAGLAACVKYLISPLIGLNYRLFHDSFDLKKFLLEVLVFLILFIVFALLTNKIWVAIISKRKVDA